MTHKGSLDFKLVQRVCLLQQALDQALHSLEALRSQVQNQHWLEAQLAKTEKYANVQQQAIAYLKQQLAQVTDTQRQLLQTMLDRLETLIDSQQTALHRLQLQIQQGEAELQTYLQHLRNHCQEGQNWGTIAPDAQRLDLESEVMIARSVTVSLSGQLQTARGHIQTLGSILEHHHADLTRLTTAIQETLNELEPETASVAPSSAIAPALLSPDDPDDAVRLRQTIRRQQTQIQELEMVLVDQFARQTQLKQRCQSLAAERDYYKRQLDQPQSQGAAPTDTTAAATFPHCPALAPTPPQDTEWPWRRRLRPHPPPPIQPLQLPEEPA